MDERTFQATLTRLLSQAHPVEGLFGPHSITWELNREMVLYLGGMRALLLQLAHPAVARGVATHSRYRQDPMGRALRTFRTVQTLLFGTPEAVREAAERTFRIHGYVRGEVNIVGSPRSFTARDEDLLLWVYATLVDSAMLAYETFLKPLPRAIWEQAYEEGKRIAQLFGISLETLPPTLTDFEQYFRSMLESDVLEVTDEARDIVQALFREVLWLRAMAPLNRLLAAAMLPERFREAFNLPWSTRHRVTFSLLQQSTRLLVPHLPPVLRHLPAARRAVKRISRTGGKFPPPFRQAA